MGKRNHFKRLCRAWVAVCAICLPFQVSAVTFNISSTGNAQADAGFAAAGAYWSSVITDAVTVNINAGFANLGAGTLGQAGSFGFSTS